MARKRLDNSPSGRDDARRLDAILRGAFAGVPTPLKDIPTRTGQPRKLDRPTTAPGAPPTHKPRSLKRKTEEKTGIM